MKKNNITIKEVAQLAGVSQATAARVIGDYGSYSKKAQKSVEKAVAELKYIPNALARGMKTKQTKTIALVVGSIHNDFFSEIIGIIEKIARRNNFNLYICSTSEDVKTEIKVLKNLHSSMVDGIIISPAYEHKQKIRDKNLYLYEGKIPVVYIDRKVEGLHQQLVITNNEEAGYKCGKYLISLGHSKIGILSSKKYWTMEDRVKGIVKAFREKGILDLEKHIIRVNYKSHEESRKATGILLDSHPDITALVGLNNDLGIGVLLELKRREIKIKEDISLITWDDGELQRLLDISVMSQPVVEIAEKAVELLFNLMKTDRALPNNVILKTKFIERQSCKNLINE